MRLLSRLKKSKKSLIIFTIFFVGLMALTFIAAFYSILSPSTSNLRVPEYVNMTTKDSTIDKVSIDSLGQFHLNGKHLKKVHLENELKKNAELERNGKYKMTISPKSGAKTEDVVTIMDMAMRLGIDAVLDVEK